MLDCRKATELAQAGLDRSLSPWARLILGAHRLICAPCRIYKRQLAQLRCLVGQMRDTADPTQRLDEAARERIRAHLRQRGQD